MFTVQGLQGLGCKRPLGCCGEFSKQLLSASIFSFSFREIPPIHAPPPHPNKHLASHTAKPGSLPRILQQTLRLGWGFSHPGPRTCPGILIVLNHSSYPLIRVRRCPLSLVSDLHICWNTVGCLLCSSDQLGVSLVLRGSELCSHLSRRHLVSEKNV